MMNFRPRINALRHNLDNHIAADAKYLDYLRKGHLKNAASEGRRRCRVLSYIKKHLEKLKKDYKVDLEAELKNRSPKFIFEKYRIYESEQSYIMSILFIKKTLEFQFFKELISEGVTLPSKANSIH
jgi:hypothetical protein